MYRGKATAIYSYKSEAPDELSFRRGAVIHIKSTKGGGDWWYGEYDGSSGCVPKKYLELSEIGQCKVIKSYIPGEKKDKMRLLTNDVIDILIKEDDEWFGRNGKAEGWFPPSHVKEMEINQKEVPTPNIPLVPAANIGSEFDVITSDTQLLGDLRKGRTRSHSTSNPKNHRFILGSTDEIDKAGEDYYTHTKDDEQISESLQILEQKSEKTVPIPTPRVKQQQSLDSRKSSFHPELSKKLSLSPEPTPTLDVNITPPWLRELKEKKRLLREKKESASANGNKTDILSSSPKISRLSLVSLDNTVIEKIEATNYLIDFTTTANHNVETTTIDIKKANNENVKEMVIEDDKIDGGQLNISKTNGTKEVAKSPTENSTNHVEIIDEAKKNVNLPVLRKSSDNKTVNQRRSSCVFDTRSLSCAPPIPNLSKSVANLSTEPSTPPPAYDEFKKRIEFLETVVATLLEQNTDIQKQLSEMKRRAQ